MARDRKRAKQRRERRAPRGAATAAHSELHRADLPGALEHASGEVDEFDAALVRGAGGLPVPTEAPEAPPAELDGPERGDGPPDRSTDGNGAPSSELLPAAGGGGPPARRGGGGGNGLALDPAGDGAGDRMPAPAEAAGRAVEHREPRRRLPSRAAAFLRASWAELQRVQWPDRAQVSQATAVVLGFVAVAGVYLGAADWVAQKIVNFIL
ncbi:MAG: preprotein translocase subunit SecE [Solirubrobacteraceae bacterium]